MARYARLYYPGGIFHVISRCLNHEFLIGGPRDRERYLALLARALERCDAQVLAYCLMSNHVHLVVRAGEDPLEKLLKPVHTGYALWKNAREGRIGPVFAGRFKSPLVDEDAYLLELVRYVHNNPVRAKLVPSAQASSWSSHRAFLGLEPAQPWLRVGDVLGLFHEDPAEARRKFAAFVGEGDGEERRADFAGDALGGAARAAGHEIGDAWRLSHPIVGDETFAAKVMAVLKASEEASPGMARFDAPGRGRPTLEAVLARCCEALGLARWEFDQRPGQRRPHLARMVATWLWVRVYGGSQAQIARALGTSAANVSNWYGAAVRRFLDIEPLADAVRLALAQEADEGALESPNTQRVHYHLAIEDEPPPISKDRPR